MKQLFYLFRPFRRILYLQRRENHDFSTIFVPGRLAGEIYQIAKPHFNPNDIAKDLELIRRSCELRAIDLDCDVMLVKLHQWHDMKQEYKDIVEKNQDLESNLKKEQSTENFNDAAPKKQKRHMEQLVDLRKKLHDIEDEIMPILQKIPNAVDPGTPILNDDIQIIIKPNENGRLTNNDIKEKSHTEIAEHLLEFNNAVSPASCFMTGKLSELEMAIQSYFWEKFQNGRFSPLLCVDFCKSFIVEATGKNPHSPEETIVIQSKEKKNRGQKLHLVGGASFEAMCAYMVSMNAGKSTFPARYFSLGRSYDAKFHQAHVQNLFSLVQSTNLQVVTLSEQSIEEEEFNILCNLISSCYQELHLPFRIVDVCIGKLNLTESRRKQFELWSPYQQEFIPVGHVSCRRDFVSRRLRITMGTDYTIEGHPSIVEGTAMKVPTVIGCIVENYFEKEKSFEIPKVLMNFMPA